jgi:hypothetical protein
LFCALQTAISLADGGQRRGGLSQLLRHAAIIFPCCLGKYATILILALVLHALFLYNTAVRIALVIFWRTTLGEAYDVLATNEEWYVFHPH